MGDRHYYQENRSQVLERNERYRQRNRNSIREANVRLRQRKQEFLWEILGTDCVDCSEDRPGALQYHHPKGRDATQPKFLLNLGWDTLKEEMMNIIVLCGTCHNLRHRKAESNGR